MQYRYFIAIVTLVFAIVMTSGCTGLLMGDLKAEIHDNSAITLPLPVSSVLSVITSQDTAMLPVNQSPTDEKMHTFFGIRFLVILRST